MLESKDDANAEVADWRGTDRFEVIRCIGRGGVGTVYEARDRERRQRIALKTLLHFDPAALFMFKQEFRTLADVQHPSLVRLHELFAIEGEKVFFTMELVRGTDFLTHVLEPRRAARGADASAAVSLEPGEELRSQVRLRSAPPPLTSDAPAAARRAVSPADLDRLRTAIKQLVEGLQALHDANKLHRDIKPSNVLVTPEGRVVILDFGVATDVPRVDDKALREEGQIVGSARYMAPEQAFDEAPTPACDWYSVGVMLYEALVGATPFAGTSAEVIQAKNSVDARPPSSLVDGVPADLDALCMALLDRDPARRPGGRDVLRRLGALRGSMPAPAPSGTAASGTLLVGREAQLGALHEAFALARGQKTVAVYASGRAGMGKSVLLQHFLDGLVERGDAVVLRGRAYERESVPYKAIDAVIDALSRHLMNVSDSDGTVVLPTGVGALARLFPVLRRVPAVSEVAEEPAGDPREVRRRALQALRDLVVSLASRRPLVLYIDDVQWGDTDSATLLLELVRPPHAPSVLLIMAHREEDAARAPFLNEMRARWPAGVELREVAVGPLDQADARRLSLAILGSEDAASRTIAEAAARESEGNPFLIVELTRSSTGGMLASKNDRVTLEQMVSDRLGRLPAEARRMAELVAVGGRPLPVSMIGDAAGIASTDEVVALLSMLRFVRTGLRDGREVVEPVHDRVRETIVSMLAEPVLKGHHGRLARVLEATPGADPEAIAVHLLGAGEADRGARFAERAAKQAAQQLAFDHAARLYRLTIDTLPASSPKIGRLRRRHGEVLGFAGRSEEAGRAYLAAADGAEAAERLALECAGSEQLLAAGRIAEGGQVLRRVLAGAGVPAPATQFATVFWLIMYKLRLKVFGLAFKERSAEEVRPEDHARIGALHVAALNLASVDTLLAACMQARQMVVALKVGDRSEVLRAGIIYGIHLATRGGKPDKHEQALHALIAHLSATASPDEVAHARGTEGVGVWLRGRWRESIDTIDRAYANIQGQVAGRQAQAGLYAVYALVFLGDFVELRRRHARQLADADQRGDLFTSVQLRASHPVVLHLAADDPEAARRQTQQVKAQWPQDKFLTQHWQVMRSEAEIELYAGEGPKAYERLLHDEQVLKRSMLLNVQFIRGCTLFVRGRAAIASIDPANPAARTARLAEARKLARALEREGMAWTEPLASILEAAVLNAEGKRSEALPLLERAAERATAADMALYAACARYVRGLALGGVQGAELLANADEALRAQEVRAPSRFASMLVPGKWD